MEMLLSPAGAVFTILIAVFVVAFVSGVHGPRWLAVVSGIGLLAILALLTKLAIRNLKWTFQKNRCPRCGYNRSGLDRGDKCPECGHSPRSILDFVRPRRWRP